MILWAPKHGNKKPGRPALKYIDIIKKDTEWDSDSIKTAMQDHGVWKAIVDRDTTHLRQKKKLITYILQNILGNSSFEGTF